MTDASLRINEIFFSIQGESTLAGKPSVFVRTAACNLRCTWCDTKYAYWKGKRLSVPEIVEEVSKHQTKYVCLTGGEPLGQHAIYPLMNALLEKNYTVSLETNGSFSVLNVPKAVVKVIDIKCPESGETNSMAWENFDLVQPHDQFKFVIASKEDFDWAIKTTRQHKLEEKCTVLYSPAYGKVKPADLAEWILSESAPVTMQTQLHKTIWGPDQTGV